ncbi:MAG: hypothetical protein M1824_006641 [Vezdaea acicularis]|nr:MAG: hypothetical protein M1824_006641 [Vezdaea acicularis]
MSSLLEVWNSAASSPFQPTIGKNNQLLVGSVLLFGALLLTGYFSLNRSLVNVALVGVPASLAVGFGAVYTICAVGVYV